MAQWLEHRSLASGLSLIYAWSIVDVTTSWVKCLLWVNHQANSAFHPFGTGKWVVIHVITWSWIMGWRPLNCRPGQRIAVSRRSESRGCGLSLWPIGCTSTLSVMYRCNCRLWHYTSVMPVPFATVTIHLTSMLSLQVFKCSMFWCINDTLKKTNIYRSMFASPAVWGPFAYDSRLEVEPH